MTTVKKFKINDIVRINEEDIHDSADYDFMMQYAGQDLSIVNEKLVDGYDLWHYTCKDGNGDIITYNAYNAEPVPFAFIDADLKDATLAKIEEKKANLTQIEVCVKSLESFSQAEKKILIEYADLISQSELESKIILYANSLKMILDELEDKDSEFKTQITDLIQADADQYIFD